MNKIISFAISELKRISCEYDNSIQTVYLDKIEEKLMENVVYLLSDETYAHYFNKKLTLIGDGYEIIHNESNTFIISKTERGLLYGSYEYCFHIFGYQKNRFKESFPKKSYIEGKAVWLKNPSFKRRSIVVEEIEDLEFLLILIDWSARNGINELFFTFKLWSKFHRYLLPEIEKRGLNICLGGHSLEFLSGNTNENFNNQFFDNKKQIDKVILNTKSYLSKSKSIQRISLWPKDKGIDSKDRNTFLKKYIKFSQNLASEIDIKVEFIAYNAGLSWSMLERKEPWPDNLDVLFAYWGRNYSKNIQETEKNQIHSNLALTDWISQKGNNSLTVFEYYCDLFMLTELFPPLASRISTDIEYYKSIGVDGISNLLVPLKKSKITKVSKENSWEFIYEFNNFCFSQALWGSTEEKMYEEFFYGVENDLEFDIYVLKECEGALSALSEYNRKNFPSRIVDSLSKEKNFIEILEKIQHVIKQTEFSNIQDTFLRKYIKFLEEKIQIAIGLMINE